MVIKQKDTNKIALKVLEESSDDFISRDYQIDLIDNSLKRSIVLCSDNQDMKLFVMLMLIRKFMKIKPHSIVFMSDDPENIDSYSQIVSRHCNGKDFKLVMINYELDERSDEFWSSCLAHVALLIIDNCQKVLDECGRLRYILHFIPDISNVHVYGMNSPLINQLSVGCKVEKQIQEIEKLLCCHVDIGTQSVPQTNSIKTVDEVNLYYSEEQTKIRLAKFVLNKLEETIEFLSDMEPFQRDESSFDSPTDLYAYCLNSCLKCKEILENLGIWCCCIVARAFIRHLIRHSMSHKIYFIQDDSASNDNSNDVKLKEQSAEDEIGRILRHTTSLMTEIVKVCTFTFDKMADYEEFQSVMSNKVRNLVDFLKGFKPSLNFKIEAIKLPTSSKGSVNDSGDCSEDISSEQDIDGKSDTDFDTTDDSVATDDDNPSVDRGGPTFRSKSCLTKRSKRKRTSSDGVTKNSGNRFLFRAVIPEKSDDNESFESENFEKMNCLIYVNCSFTAYALSRFLDELCIWDPDLFFLHPGHVFTVSDNQNENKTNGAVSLGQEETINQFRRGIVNCLVTTQILDTNKFDLQKCNLVIRFDPVLNLQQYFNCKSRAGVVSSSATMLRKANSSVAEAISNVGDKSKAKLIHMIPKENSEDLEKMISDFRKVESGIFNRLTKLSSNQPERDTNTNLSLNEINGMEPPLISEPPNCKEVYLSKAISLVNLYCARLPTDIFTKLTPELKILSQKVDGKMLYQCELYLPINSPHRLRTKGKWMPSVALSKMSSALATLRQLYELKELDNNFHPWNKEDNRDTEASCDDKNDTNLGGMLMGSSKCRHCYQRKFAKCISVSPISADTKCFVYEINIVLSRQIPDEQNIKGRKLMISQTEPRGFGLICAERGLENTLTFPVFTRSGEEEVSIIQLNNPESRNEFWSFSEEQFGKILQFHNLMFTSIFRIKLDKNLIFDIKTSSIKLLLVPLNKDISLKIDWEFMDVIINSYRSSENICCLDSRRKSNGNFEFVSSDFENAVVIPSYRNVDHRQYYYVADICWNMKPTTDFPGEHFSTFAEYYTKKYGARISNYQQPLLDADFSVMRLNMTTPRHVNFKGVPLPLPSEAKKKSLRESVNQKQFLIPELCYIHPFPATLWHKAACLPTILHRINQLLLAEELRHEIAVESGLGPLSFRTENEKLVLDYNLFGGLRNRDELDSKSPCLIGNYLNETRIVDDVTNDSTDEATSDVLRSDTDYGQFIADKFLGENEQEYLESSSDVESIDSFEGDGIRFMPEEDNIRYDIAVQRRNDDKLSDQYIQKIDRNLPGPNLILEALTMLCSSDFINLERMETVGDSFLKYASTVYNFLKHPYAHEGRLSYLRSKQVSNSNLYLKAKEKHLMGYLNSQKFSPQDNWMFPGYRFDQNVDVCEIMSENYSAFYPRTQHFLTDKNLADVVESLTGCYLTTRGEFSALRLLQWFNIDLNPIDEDSRDTDLLRATDSSIRAKTPFNGEFESNEQKQLYYGLCNELTGLEDLIAYEFKEKSYLLQAVSHSSFYLNTFTDCYQRLELLGDAVLDYVITRFLYEDCRRHSPGDLTDLRSALVNNNIFAALVVKFNIYKYFMCISPMLWKMIDKFVYYQKVLMKDDLDFVIHQETRQGHAVDSVIDEDIEIPKCLGDIFESLAGAVFLDSGMDLNVVWNVFQPLFQERIERYTSLIPKSPVRQLLELKPDIVNFEYPKHTTDGKTRVCVRVIGIGRFYGVGRNYRIAKSVAAKKALKRILNEG